MQLVITGNGSTNTFTGTVDELTAIINEVINVDEFLEVQSCYDELTGKLDDSQGLAHVVEWFNLYTHRTGLKAELSK